MAEDIYGITKLYPDATGGAAQVWYMSTSGDPRNDPRLNIASDATFTLHADGGWIIRRPSSNVTPAIRLEAYSESGTKKWLNVEITIYSYLMEDTNPPDISSYVLHLYTRGGTHSPTRNCEGSAYKARLKRTDGGASFTKEIAHNAYAAVRSSPAPAQYLTQCGPTDRWIGSKFVVYNLPVDIGTGRTPVKLEYYVDEDGMAKNGTFDTNKQNWRLLGYTTDTGGWEECDISDDPLRPVSDCPVIEIGNITGQRQCDEILNTGGGTNSPNGFVPPGNVVVYRTDSIVSRVKWFSGREIIPPT